MSSFQNELLQSEAFANMASQVDNKSVVAPPSRLDITDDDLDEYHEHEGKELFGTRQNADHFAELLMQIM